MDGTVSEARRDEGLPVRWGTPDADMTVAGCATRVSILLGLVGGLEVSVEWLGIVFLVAAAFGATAGLTAVAGAVLAAGRLVLVGCFPAAGLTAFAAVGRGATLADAEDPDTCLAAGLAAFNGVLVAVLALAGVAFTS
jgi:hypothetical protein